MIKYPLKLRLNIKNDVESYTNFVSSEICHKLYQIRRT